MCYGGGVSVLFLGFLKYFIILIMFEKKKMKGLFICFMIYVIIIDLNIFGNFKVDNVYGSLYLLIFWVDVFFLFVLVFFSLEMIELDVVCYISIGFVIVKSRWNLNCVWS